MIFNALEQECSIFLFLSISFSEMISNRKSMQQLSPCWFHSGSVLGLKSVASDQKSSTCIFKGRNSENANTWALSGIRKSIFMHFPIFLSCHVMQHSMLFLAFSVLDAIKPTNRLIVVLLYDFPRTRATSFQIFQCFFSTSISDMISDRKSTQKLSQNGAQMQPKWLTKRLLGALGPPLLHQGLPKGRRGSKNGFFGSKMIQNSQEIRLKHTPKKRNRQTDRQTNDRQRRSTRTATTTRKKRQEHSCRSTKWY